MLYFFPQNILGFICHDPVSYAKGSSYWTRNEIEEKRKVTGFLHIRSSRKMLPLTKCWIW